MIANMINTRGNAVANQFIIIDEGTGRVTFRSYKSIIAHRSVDGSITLDSHYWDYSATTLRYLKLFLCTKASKAAIQAHIDSGKYFTANLN